MHVTRAYLVETNEHDIVLSAWLGGHVIISSPSALHNFRFEKTSSFKTRIVLVLSEKKL